MRPIDKSIEHKFKGSSSNGIKRKGYDITHTSSVNDRSTYNTKLLSDSGQKTQSKKNYITDYSPYDIYSPIHDIESSSDFCVFKLTSMLNNPEWSIENIGRTLFVIGENSDLYRKEVIIIGPIHVNRTRELIGFSRDNRPVTFIDWEEYEYRDDFITDIEPDGVNIIPTDKGIFVTAPKEFFEYSDNDTGGKYYCIKTNMNNLGKKFIHKNAYNYNPVQGVSYDKPISAEAFMKENKQRAKGFINYFRMSESDFRSIDADDQLDAEEDYYESWYYLYSYTVIDFLIKTYGIDKLYRYPIERIV